MELITKIQVDNLTEKSVSILTQTFSNIDGVECQVGNNHRTGYINSPKGRNKLASDVADPHYTDIMNVWGDSPIAEDLIFIIEDNSEKGDSGTSTNNDMIAYDVSLLAINGTSVSQTSNDTITIGG